jgi:MFS family permease
MGVYSFVNYLQYYLQDVFEDKYATVGSSLLLACVLTIGVLVSPLAGFLSDYIPRKYIVVIASLFTSVVIMINLFLTLFKGPLWGVYVACSFLGIGIGTFYAVDWALGIDAIPRKENIAKDMGIWHVSDTIPSMIAPLITGLILSNMKPIIGERYAWSLAFAFSCFWFLMSGFCMMFIYIKKKNPEGSEQINKEGKSILLDVVKSPRRSPRGMPIELSKENSENSADLEEVTL